jgi:AraC-like DNA-binding protein
MLSPLSLDNTQRVCWRLIEGHQALTLQQVAHALDRTPSQFRRALRELGTNFRRLRARARVTYAVQAIERGEKVEAVIREVGLHNRTSFIKQCRFYTGKNPGSFQPPRARVNGNGTHEP